MSKAETKKTATRTGAVVLDDAPQDGNLVNVVKPKFLSLVGLPANTTGFKVVRKDAEGEKVKPVIRRTRRSDATPVLRLTFPKDTTREDVDAAIAAYGMKDYRIEESEDGVFTAVRSDTDLQSIAKMPTQDIKLNEAGVTATVARAAEEAQNPGAALTLATIEFDGEKFDKESATEWLKRNSIDSEIAEKDNSASAFVVRRSDVKDGDDVRHLTLDEGVTGTIIRSDVMNIPDGFVAVINETAYGSWGWGQLDFNAALAGVAFAEQSREALNLLDSVLRDIIFYSSLPLDVRKQLANAALAQFGAYIGSMMDALPRTLLLSVVERSSKPTNPENGNMTQKNASGAPATTEATADDTQPLTRGDAKALIADAVKTALEAQAAATAQRSDGTQPAAAAAAATPAAGTEAAAATTTATPAAAAPAGLTRSDMVEAMKEVMAPFAERLGKVEQTDVVRSDGTDAATEPAGGKGKEATKQDVFRGAIFGPRGADTGRASE